MLFFRHFTKNPKPFRSATDEERSPVKKVVKKKVKHIERLCKTMVKFVGSIKHWTVARKRARPDLGSSLVYLVHTVEIATSTRTLKTKLKYQISCHITPFLDITERKEESGIT